MPARTAPSRRIDTHKILLPANCGATSNKRWDAVQHFLKPALAPDKLTKPAIVSSEHFCARALPDLITLSDIPSYPDNTADIAG